VRHRRRGQRVAHDLDEPAQPGRALGHHRGQRPGRQPLSPDPSTSTRTDVEHEERT
jgi:hypothetical protein